jgi:cytidine deaminase
MKELIREAGKVMKRAITPYSRFRVGAAVSSKRGRIYTGCNLENPSLMLSVCAEKVALFNALSSGEKSFRAIAIASGDGNYCYPCGSCRQVLWEFAGDMDVYLLADAGIKKYSLSELLPYPFSTETV